MLNMNIPSKKEIAIALNRYIKEANTSTDAVGKKCGFSQRTAANLTYEDGHVPSSSTIRKLFDAIPEIQSYISNQQIALNKTDSRHNSPVEYDNLEEAPDLRTGQYPLISWVQAGEFEEAFDNFEVGDAEKWMPSPIVNCSSKTYILRVRGDSMTAPHGRTYPEGILIYVDPEQKSPDSGAPVIAKVNGDNAVTFKQYINDGGNIYLKPLNPTHIPITKPFSILGTVVFAGFEP